jgi:F-type H+-transporting ATPase subunit delta
MQTVTVTTAIELSKALVAEIKTDLEKKLKAKIELKLQVDPEVLGGISITVGSTHYDATYQYKIDQISKAFNG